MENSPLDGILKHKSRDNILDLVRYSMKYLTSEDLDGLHHEISMIQIKRKKNWEESTSKMDILDKLNEIDDPVSGI